MKCTGQLINILEIETGAGGGDDVCADWTIILCARTTAASDIKRGQLCALLSLKQCLAWKWSSSRERVVPSDRGEG